MSATAPDLFLLFPLWPPSSAHSSVSLTSSLFDSVSPLWPLPQPLDHETRQTIQFDFQHSPKGRVHLCPLVLPVLATLRLAPASRPYARSGLPWSSGEGENINYRHPPPHCISSLRTIHPQILQTFLSSHSAYWPHYALMLHCQPFTSHAFRLTGSHASLYPALILAPRTVL